MIKLNDIIKNIDGWIMDIQIIKTFVHVAKRENFTKAAEDLNYAQSSVTMQVQRLEKELGVPLFERVGRKNYLTVVGREFLSYAEKILLLTEKASVIGKDLKSMKGEIKIGILESLLFSKFLPVLSSFSQKFPNIEVIVKIGQTVELVELLKQNKLDIIYVSTDEQTDPLLNCLFKKKEELVFAVSSDHPLSLMKNLAVQEVFNYSFVVTEQTGYCYKHLLKIASENTAILRHGMVVDSVSAIKTLISNGQSVAFLPKYSLKDEIENKSLSIVSCKLPPQIYYSQLICTKDKWMSPFIEELVEEIKAL